MSSPTTGQSNTPPGTAPSGTSPNPSVTDPDKSGQGNPTNTTAPSKVRGG
jgi:hypothetical protein